MLSVTTNIGSYTGSLLQPAAGRGEGREYETVTGVCSNIVTSSNQSITCHYSEHFHHEPQDLCSVSAGAGQESQRYNVYLYTTKYNLFSAYIHFLFCCRHGPRARISHQRKEPHHNRTRMPRWWRDSGGWEGSSDGDDLMWDLSRVTCHVWRCDAPGAVR